jgi:hypothetical protein
MLWQNIYMKIKSAFTNDKSSFRRAYDDLVYLNELSPILKT